MSAVSDLMKKYPTAFIEKDGVRAKEPAEDQECGYVAGVVTETGSTSFYYLVPKGDRRIKRLDATEV